MGTTIGRLQAAFTRKRFSPFLFLPSSFVTFCGAITFCGELRLELGFPDSLLMMEPFWLGDRLQVTIATREAVSSSPQTSFQGYFICTVCTTEFSSLILYQNETEYKQRAQTQKSRHRPTAWDHCFSIRAALISILSDIKSSHFSCTAPTISEAVLQRTKTPVINSVTFIELK